MFNPVIVYSAIGAVIASFLMGFGLGWKIENGRFTDFKETLIVATAKQEAENQSIKKQTDLVSKGIKNEYEAKIAALRNYYSSGLHNSSSGKMPSLSNPPIGADANPSYSVLAGQCSETTQQLVSLQEWLNQVVGLK